MQDDAKLTEGRKREEKMVKNSLLGQVLRKGTADTPSAAI
jgi:hypothetical protein